MTPDQLTLQDVPGLEAGALAPEPDEAVPLHLACTQQQQEVNIQAGRRKSTSREVNQVWRIEQLPRDPLGHL